MYLNIIKLSTYLWKIKKKQEAEKFSIRIFLRNENIKKEFTYFVFNKTNMDLK